MKRFAAAFTVLIAVCSVAHAGKKQESKTNSAFEQIKGLAGTWTGKATMGGKEQTIVTKFRVTSGGSAVEETLFAGSDHEMVDMYYLDGDTVMMTHYCAMGNQPRLKLASMKGKKLEFTYVDATNLPSPDAPHMNGITLTLGKDKLVEDWASTGGEHKEPDSFVFTREP